MKKGPFGREWFLREQEGLEGSAGLRKNTTCIVTRENMNSLWLWQLIVLICIAFGSWSRCPGKRLEEVGSRALVVGTERRRHPLGFLGGRQCGLVAT